MTICLFSAVAAMKGEKGGPPAMETRWSIEDWSGVIEYTTVDPSDPCDQ